MQFLSFSTMAVALTAFSAQAFACVDFQITITQFGYGTGTLTDNGAQICKYNGYGDNTGYSMKCNSGYSARVNNAGDHVTYNTPHGSYSFAPSCKPYDSGTPGANQDVCMWRGFGC